MVREQINKFAVYRFRYALAYVAFAVALASMLLIAGFYLPGGLNESEVRSALVSDGLNPAALFSLRPDELIYLPYRLLQAGTISLFGISILGIKLPSIILGFVSAIGILYLLNLWYRRNVAIVTAMIAVTMNQFLLSAQAGQAGIMYIFLTTMVLIAASMIARRSAYAKLWLIAGFVLAGISLYMPLNIYMLIALALTGLIHPHARHMIVRRAPKGTVALGVVLFGVIISPLVIGAIKDLDILWTLLGFADGIGNLGTNAALLAQQYTTFAEPTSSSTITPVYGLGLVMLIGVGLYRLFSAKYTARSYIISFWLLFLIPLVCLNPAFVSITFIPVLLLIALAIDYLIWSWYRLFPKNPYARVFGLLPLSVLVLGLVVSSIDRYVYGLQYDRAVYETYSFDLPLLDRTLRAFDDKTAVTLVVDKRNAAFYRSYARHQRSIDDMTVVTAAADRQEGSVLLVERSLKDTVAAVPSQIIVNRTSQDADRFYLYKK